jgi:hypothetical protein
MDNLDKVGDDLVKRITHREVNGMEEGLARGVLAIGNQIADAEGNAKRSPEVIGVTKSVGAAVANADAIEMGERLRTVAGLAKVTGIIGNFINLGEVTVGGIELGDGLVIKEGERVYSLALDKVIIFWFGNAVCSNLRGVGWQFIVLLPYTTYEVE